MSFKSELINIVGTQGLVEDPSEIRQKVRSVSIFEKGQLPRYVVRPALRKQVRDIVLLCNEYGVNVTPSSSTIHFHDGSTPYHDGIILDMSGLTKILSIDLRNRNIKIEPGVTWTHVRNALKNTGMMVVTSINSGSFGSVITSCLEREPRLIPKFEYGEPISSLEMIWPTGDYFRTGTASSRGFPGNFADGCYPYGPGPIDPMRLLQGAQGTMGIVTWAIIKIENKPKKDKAYLIVFDSLDLATEAIYAIQKRRIGNECFALNGYGISMLLKHFKGNNSLPDCVSVPIWAIVLVISGGKWFPEEKIEYEERELFSLKDALFPSSTILTPEKGPRWLSRLPQFLRSSGVSPMQHYNENSRTGIERLFFIAPLEKSPTFIHEICKKIALAGLGNLDLGIYLQPIDYCAGAHLEFDFHYHNLPPQALPEFKALFIESVECALNLGAHFTRPYGRLISRLVFNHIHNSYPDLLNRIKNIVDPNRIMNPGKLCF